MKMKTVAIVAKPKKPELGRIVSKAVEWLLSRQYRVILDREASEYASGEQTVERSEIAAKKPDFVLVLGGDGTMLSAVRAVAKAHVPILGVNLGSLGFLTEVPLGELYPTLEAIENGQCGVETRAMLHCELERGIQETGAYDALNEIVVSKTGAARLGDFAVSLDGVFVSKYMADGLIVATPTGSTAYSLAAGGPILSPRVDAFVITPISPHALTNRPLVVRDSVEVAITLQNSLGDGFLTVDGQEGVAVQDGDRVVCHKSQLEVRFLHLAKRDFYEVLRTKLKWGER
jgi:NAD+ kinase